MRRVIIEFEDDGVIKVTEDGIKITEVPSEPKKKGIVPESDQERRQTTFWPVFDEELFEQYKDVFEKSKKPEKRETTFWPSYPIPMPGTIPKTDPWGRNLPCPGCSGLMCIAGPWTCSLCGRYHPGGATYTCNID